MNFFSGLTLGVAILSVACFCAVSVRAEAVFEKDTFKTSGGDLEITFIGHGSLMMRYQGKIIHIDPFSQAGDYSALPKADLILITHDHMDHLDTVALKAVRTDKSQVVLTAKCAEKVSGGKVMANGDSLTIMGVRIDAVPAYNLLHKRPDGQPFHPKGEGNGYVLTFGDVRVYVAGDTENIPEMRSLKNIDIAFLPMNLPYTMTPEMVADAARSFMPKVLYPYHFGETDTTRIVELLERTSAIDVRIRKMK
jgi:L-ascorbate metabolism protein UlaG (beta-lactamase superfamily)